MLREFGYVSDRFSDVDVEKEEESTHHIQLSCVSTSEKVFSVFPIEQLQLDTKVKQRIIDIITTSVEKRRKRSETLFIAIIDCSLNHFPSFQVGNQSFSIMVSEHFPIRPRMCSLSRYSIQNGLIFHRVLSRVAMSQSTFRLTSRLN